MIKGDCYKGGRGTDDFATEAFGANNQQKNGFVFLLAKTEDAILLYVARDY